MREQILYNRDKKTSSQYHKRQTNTVKSILEEIPRKYISSIKFQDITDEDDIKAIQKVKIGQRNLPPMVKRLKTEAIKFQLQDLDDQLSKKDEIFTPKVKSYAFLRTYGYHSDEEIQNASKRILESINAEILDNIVRKYNVWTTLNMLALNEKEALNTLRPKRERDKNIDPFLLHLYWQIKDDQLNSTIDIFREKRSEYSIPEAFYKWLKFCCHGGVPERMKSKARWLIRNLDRTFGKGVVPGSEQWSD